MKHVENIICTLLFWLVLAFLNVAFTILNIVEWFKGQRVTARFIPYHGGSSAHPKERLNWDDETTQREFEKWHDQLRRNDEIIKIQKEQSLKYKTLVLIFVVASISASAQTRNKNAEHVQDFAYAAGAWHATGAVYKRSDTVTLLHHYKWRAGQIIAVRDYMRTGNTWHETSAWYAPDKEIKLIHALVK